MSDKITYKRDYFGSGHDLMGYFASNGAYIDKEMRVGTWGVYPDGYAVLTSPLHGECLYRCSTLKEAKAWIESNADVFKNMWTARPKKRA